MLGSTKVEIAFDAAVQPGSIAGAITLRDANNALVPGTQTPIFDLDGLKIVGLSFTPTQPLKDGITYTATLKGGASGVKNRRQPPDAERLHLEVHDQQRGCLLPMTRR